MYSSCSASCGVSLKTRNRTCASPPPQFGGLSCVGFSNETLQCTTQLCPFGKYTEKKKDRKAERQKDRKTEKQNKRIIERQKD
jgi:hypothetical protein